jgi:hypothetical protein
MAAFYSNPHASDLPPYAAQQRSYSLHPNLPPAPPPKPRSQDVSRQGTPAASQSLPSPPPGEQSEYTQAAAERPHEEERDAAERLQDPGDRWLPKLLQHKAYVGSSPTGSTARG